MNRKIIRSVVLFAAVAVLGGCEETLTVQNPNQGETSRVLGTPADAENLLGSFYRRWMSGVYGSGTDVQGMANIFSLMNYSSLANDGQNSHAPFSGATNYNNPGNVVQNNQFRLYSILSEVNRVESEFRKKVIGGLTLGSPAQDARAMAFANFLRGLSLGYIAMMHDSAGIVTENTGPLDAGVLYGYSTVAESAYVAFERALTLTDASLAATGGNGFPLPSTWIPSPTSFTGPAFKQLVRSYRARIRANMARTPAERAAVDWAAVIADAAAGITADHEITTSTTTGPDYTWRNRWIAGLWHQMPPFFIGMADTSGSYAAWIATPVSARGAGNNGFFMATPDLRFPQGATRTAQIADFPLTQCSNTPATKCKRYFLNRPASTDSYSGEGWGWSNYDFVRFESWRRRGDAGSARNGATMFMSASEIRLLRAEGLYRQGNFAAAGALVNVSRTAAMAGTPLVATGGGLPAITVFDATTPVPGGNACVPKVPVAPYNVIACGNLWEALKYEKRIETAYTHYVPWYLDGRGWGDLPETTPLFWAVPFQELQARGKSISQLYGAGIGAGNAPNSAAGPSVYGW